MVVKKKNIKKVKKVIKVKPPKNALNCVRQVMNFSSVESTDRFDKQQFDEEKLIDKLPIYSPKMITLFQKIKELDKKDYRKDGKLYKHFIFSDLKKGYGAKILASAFIAAGYRLVMKSNGSKIILDREVLDSDDEAKFAVLSSTALWNNPVNQTLTKEILSEFNKRPDNTYGDLCRFIILDSGFKEGIDLFDVKYVHIFEDQMANSDLTQSIGRATRYCGQKGLPFKKGEGWKLHVYNYKSYKSIPTSFLKKLKNLKFKDDKLIILDHIKKQNKDLNFNINFEESINNLIKESAVDTLLNENINNITKRKSFLKRHIIPLTIAGITAGISAGLLYKKLKKNKN